MNRCIEAGRRHILVFWHGQIVPATWYFRGRGIVVMTSRNRDGEYIARVIRRFGMRPRGDRVHGEDMAQPFRLCAL
jgi:lysophospholipid acyltransferase (LPLAT)-like uncharacterized protein